ncbi:MAG: hemolysin III family protein [Saprospiraceae bacterium]|nr:hemolysin III family protein [Saprospiraceae bacterium]MCB9324666.1 hemolysin III family protein [Lewinellaceae bacterium]
MNKTEAVKYYSPLEEKINILSHGLGGILGVVALILLVMRANELGGFWPMFSFCIFGLSLVILYAASTIYHSAQAPILRSRLRVFDHAAIYVLIAGTYTPFTLVTLEGPTGWAIFYTAWGIALAGIILKLFFTGRFSVLSTIMYVFMGWIIVFAIKPLINNLPSEGLTWLMEGGAAYTLGAILYSIKKIPFNHAIFHIFVLIGSFCHFMAVYFYVVPV